LITSLKVTVVCENTVGTPADITGEWGLALLVEVPGLAVLFDTGARGALVPNARALGIDLDRVDLAVLSHGHYDHTGGLPALLRYRRRRLPVVAHPDVFTTRFVREDGGLRHIGLPFRRVELESLGADFLLAAGPRELAPGLFVSGEVPRRLSFEKGDARLVVPDGEREKPDPLRDDLSLYAVTRRGLVIILGCAHAGVANIVTHAREVTGVEKVHAIIGGTHLGAADPAQQDATMEYLRALDIELLAANHCTGLPTAAVLARIFRERFRFAPAGSRFTLPFGY